MNTITKLIRERAANKGIEIETNPDHRRDVDHVASGRWVVIFRDDGSGRRRIYYYGGTLESVGLRLELVSEDEIALLHGEVRCPKCNRWGNADIIKRFGYCLNC